MKLWEFHVEVGKQFQYHASWRLGQTYFNVLSEHRPELAERIRGTPLDPFYKADDNLGPFQEFLYQNWGDDV